MLGVIL